MRQLVKYLNFLGASFNFAVYHSGQNELNYWVGMGCLWAFYLMSEAYPSKPLFGKEIK